MPDFSKRYSGPELMDDLQAAGADLHQALHELDAINYLLGGNYVTLNGISQLLESKPPGKALHIADLGCGSGDMLKLIRRLLEKRGDGAALTGVDANPNVIRYAHHNTPPNCRIQYDQVNICSEQFKEKRFDIITATLFFHHFQDDDLVAILTQLKDQVSLGLVINDIHRHWFSYYSIKWLTRLFSRSRMVKHDAPVSVLRAFRRKELIELLRLAGVQRFRIKWCWAFRWQVVVWF